ncbi:MAG TPA: hypothetical protein VHQ01_01570, partial [Pyrinomonadaceae bacterium]|nr:hypothetical protein [Pyrinomonadaceae bacterium]
MKRCPECGREYDNTMMFCLDDGAELFYGPASMDGSATAILHSAAAPGDAPTRAQILDTNETAILPSTTNNSTSQAASRKNSVIAGVLGILLVTALGVGSYLYYGRGSGKQIESIAVMPFVNESGNADVEYLSDGMTETLIRSLSQLANLQVKPRSSVFRYKGKETDAKTIGKELNVQAIL